MTTIPSSLSQPVTSRWTLQAETEKRELLSFVVHFFIKKKELANCDGCQDRQHDHC